MGMQADKIFVNLPVKDLQKSMAFFSEIGFEFNPQFTDENAGCLVISDHIFVMLLVEEFFQSFTKRKIADTSASTEVIIALSASSREQVDEIVQKALAAGGKAANDLIDEGFMYGGSFQDIDGHMWEVMWMDENTAQQSE
ncbi:glyoxalase/bleomycin resistance/extradiol dioxygenase family protein [Domibacillus sp. A3M-37]|uniref:VOC family protein n=1 Tax=Domibacillus TaxID=1433999 RepID=UPI000617B593|nr:MULTISPECIES: VOC family protein [Domibacillus]MCP3763347.1 glyoxalase/bleomycin resistance/extradiol dioxygenase family protein [Domibacillus sp. A3M-37]